MNETVDGEYQAMKARDGAYVREKFFGKSPEALELVSSMLETNSNASGDFPKNFSLT